MSGGEEPIQYGYDPGTKDGDMPALVFRKGDQTTAILTGDDARVVAAFIKDLAEASPILESSFQQRVEPWMLECFGPEISADTDERNHRFVEEALELVQACGATASECHQLVDYVFNRPVGEPHQESGGVMVTHAALCLANGLDMHKNGEIELARIWGKIETIRAKQAAKPNHSPLPQVIEEKSGWQPIETAPKDGTEITAGWLSPSHYATGTPICWQTNGRREGWFRLGPNGENDDGKWMPSYWLNQRDYPTHWMPLLKAPTIDVESDPA